MSTPYYSDDLVTLYHGDYLEVLSAIGGRYDLAVCDPPYGAYGCPPGGVVLDVFAGSGSTGIAARNIGRRSVLIEKREQQCERAAAWLSQGVLDFADVTA